MPRTLCLSFCVLLCSFSAFAIPFEIGLPDITSGNIQVTYNAATDLFTAVGTAFSMDTDGVGAPEYLITSGTFSLSATIDQDGNMTAGALTINGTIPALGANSGTLLSASLLSLMRDTSHGEIFMFSGIPAGGDLAASFPSVGVILDLWDSGFTGSFQQSFTNSGMALADVAPIIPEPATSALFGLSLLGFIIRRNSRK